MFKTKRYTAILLGCILFLLFIAGIVTWVLFIDKEEYLYLLILGAYLVNVFVAYFILNSKYRSETVKLSWIFVLLLFPILGFVLFFVFGTIPFSIQNQKKIKVFHKKIYEEYSFTKQYIAKNNSTIFEYNYNTLEAPIYSNNQITPIVANTEIENFVNEIRKAKKFIILQAFLISESVFLNTICYELIKKAKEGIKVWLMYDWVGSIRKISSKQLRMLSKNGVTINIFNPKGFNPLKSVTNFRTHQKCLIIDNKTAIYGSSNISDEYINIKENANYFYNNNFIVTGEIVNSLTINFLDNFLTYSNANKKQKNFAILFFKKNLEIYKVKGDTNMQFVTSSPDIVRKNILGTFVQLINNAKVRIRIATPYFFPNGEIEDAISAAIARGVDVQIIVPSKPDEKNWTILLNRMSYKKILITSAKIYEFYGFLHSKLYIFDDVTMFGSSNMDFRSLYINWENCIVSDDPKLLHVFSSIFSDLVRKSNRIKDIKQVSYSKFMSGIIQIYKPMV